MNEIRYFSTTEKEYIWDRRLYRRLEIGHRKKSRFPNENESPQRPRSVSLLRKCIIVDGNENIL